MKSQVILVQVLAKPYNCFESKKESIKVTGRTFKQQIFLNLLFEKSH